MAGLDIGPPSDPPNNFDGWSDDEIIDAMVQWFHENYEDPAHNDPYISREGGYQYIWGGPYTALDEIGIYFEDVDQALIERAVDIVEQDGILDWSPNHNRLYEEEDPLEEVENTTYQKLQHCIIELENIVNDAPFASAGIGHNKPPEIIDDVPLDVSDKIIIEKVIEELKTIGTDDEPHPKTAATEIEQLEQTKNKLAMWLAAKANLGLDKFIEGFAKEAGKRTAKAGIWAVLLEKIIDTLKSFFDWLKNF